MFLKLLNEKEVFICLGYLNKSRNFYNTKSTLASFSLDDNKIITD